MNRQIKVDLSTPVKSLVAEETPVTTDDTKDSGAEQPKGTETKTEAKPSTKPSGQSIAQVADVDNDDDTEDGAEDDGKKPTDGEDKSPKKKSSMFADLMEFKKENRELKRMMRDEIIPTMKEMQQQIKNGSLSKQEVKDELDALAEKYELEPEFVRELAGAIKSKTTKEVEDKYLSDIKEIKEDRARGKEVSREARIKQAVVTEFDRVIAENPGYAKLAKKDAVTKLILSNSEYQDMAMEDVLAEIYGDISEPGMDGYTPQGANHTKQVDLKNLSDEDHVEIAKSRERGGDDFNSYADDLINRMQGRSRHAK